MHLPMCFDLEQYTPPEQRKTLQATLRHLRDGVLNLADISAQQACIQTLQHFAPAEMDLAVHAVRLGEGGGRRGEWDLDS